jgi:hypothetical protein
MTPEMGDWFRSLSVFGMAFAAVVVVTMGIAVAIVPAAEATGAPADASPGASADASADAEEPTPVPTAAARPTVVGGSLAVSGDREATFVLDRETTADRYGLVGDEGRILFEGGDPVSVARIQYDGLEFFLDPEDCTIVPGERHDPTGVAGADISCEDITDVRDNGTISVEGRVGVAATLFGLRGDLPESGGTLALGEETLEFDGAWIVIPTGGSFYGTNRFAGQLSDPDAQAAISFDYSMQTHELSVSEVGYRGDVVTISGGCAVDEREIGVLNPHTRVVELGLRCERIAFPTHGELSLTGSVIVEMVEPPN